MDEALVPVVCSVNTVCEDMHSYTFSPSRGKKNTVQDLLGYTPTMTLAWVTDTLSQGRK